MDTDVQARSSWTALPKEQVIASIATLAEVPMDQLPPARYETMGIIPDKFGESTPTELAVAFLIGTAPDLTELDTDTVKEIVESAGNLEDLIALHQEEYSSGRIRQETIEKRLGHNTLGVYVDRLTYTLIEKSPFVGIKLRKLSLLAGAAVEKCAELQTQSE